MELNRNKLKDYATWEKLSVALPLYSVTEMIEQTKKEPICLHFGGGDQFRANVASVYQRCLNNHSIGSGVIVVDTASTIESMYTPFDNLSISVIVSEENKYSCEVIGSVAETVTYEDYARLSELVTMDSLQVFSLTLGREAYLLKDSMGGYLPTVLADLEVEPEKAKGRLCQVIALLYQRYLAGQKPLAVLSLDELPWNVASFQHMVLELVRVWKEKGLVEEGFLAYLDVSRQVSFPFTMVDKLVPEPMEQVELALSELGIDAVDLRYSGQREMAMFFNCQREQYYFYEKRFPNGNPPFGEAGVRLVNRGEVRSAKSAMYCCAMSPVLLAVGIFVELLELPTMYHGLRHRDVLTFLQELSYEECLPSLKESKVLDLEAYVDEVLQLRLPHPIMEEASTLYTENISQKIPYYLGEALQNRSSAEDFVAVPLLIAAWFRYTMGFSDLGQPYQCGNDPLLLEIQTAMKTVSFGNPNSYEGQLRPFLENKKLFSVNLVELGLAERIEEDFMSMIGEAGAVEKTLMQRMLQFGII